MRFNELLCASKKKDAVTSEPITGSIKNISLVDKYPGNSRLMQTHSCCVKLSV